MKRSDNLLAGLLVFTGLVFLTLSGVYLLNTSIDAYINTFLQLSVWLGLPIVLFGALYLLIGLRKGGKK